MLGAYVGQFLPLAGGTMSGPVEMGGSNISGGGTATFTTFIGGLEGHASFDLLATNNLSDLGSAATARSNLGLGSAAIANTGTSNGDVPIISGGTIPGSIIPTLNQNTTGTSANVTGTVALANGGTGATTASTALSNLGGLALSGGTMTGALNMGAKAISNAFEIKDNQSSPKIRLNLGGSAGAADTLICDSNGNTQIDVSTLGITVENSASFSNTSSTVSINGAFYVGGAITLDNTVTAQALQGDNYTSPNAIYVDGTNGDDAANGTAATPFQTIGQAVSVATTGTQIILAPGTYQGPVALPAGVNLLGAGREVTIVQNYDQTGGGGALTIGGSNCLIKDLTLNTNDPTSTHSGATVFIASGVTGSGSAVPTNIIFENVDFSGNYDCVNPGAYGGEPSGGTGPFIWKFRHCRFHGPCWLFYDQCGLTSYFYDCEWAGDNNPARPSNEGVPQYGCVVLGVNNAQAYVYGGAANISDSSTNAQLAASFFVVKEGLSNTVAFIDSTAINIDCPNAPSTAVVAPFASWNAGANSQATITVGPGTSYGSEVLYGSLDGQMTMRAPSIASTNAAIGMAFFANQSTPATPSGGGLLYASSGSLYWLGSSGTSTKLASA
jgi:hypothetical protein